tara:strand:- start:226 stop:1218 length:993 start_codon:yes stop_codon:yes gene_type:complete
MHKLKLVNKYLVLILMLIISCNKNGNNLNIEEIPKSENFKELGSDSPYIFGNTYFGRNNYISYYPGNLPLIITVSHGGSLTPQEIPDRTYGVLVTDSNTIELAKALRNYFIFNYGDSPYLIINNLKRTKLDANRDIVEAAQGNIYSERAFNEFHHYIRSARDDILKDNPSVLLLDIHGHGVNPDGFNDLRTWIGYLITSNQLDESDDYIDANIPINETSLRAILNKSDYSLSDLIRGKFSLGSLMEENNITSLPSLQNLSPNGSRYFSGGYITRVYGTDINHDISSIQLEFPYDGIRSSIEEINSFTPSFLNALNIFFGVHLNKDLIIND